MWRKRKELTKITLENNILPDIIRLKSKDTLYKCYALVKKCFFVGEWINQSGTA